MNKIIFTPSFNFEEKTKALTRVSWGFISLICIFTSAFVFIFHLMISSISNIKSTFISDNFLLIFLPMILVFAFVFGIGLYKFLTKLLYSYEFVDNKIIKGMISKQTKSIDSNLASSIALSYKLLNLGSNNLLTTINIHKFNKILNLIKLNCNKEFVNEFFDTDIYKRKVYTNPKLIGETKSSLIYMCDENKKLVIPKIYDGMEIKNYPKTSSSLVSRIMVRSLFITILLILFSAIDLIIGFSVNDKYIYNINATCNSISQKLVSSGFEEKSICRFRKKISTIYNSSASFNVDHNGNINSVDIELFYDKSSYDAKEIKMVLDILSPSSLEVDKISSGITDCLNGTCSYGVFRINNYIFRIGRSGNYVSIYSRR